MPRIFERSGGRGGRLSLLAEIVAVDDQARAIGVFVPKSRNLRLPQELAIPQPGGGSPTLGGYFQLKIPPVPSLHYCGLGVRFGQVERAALLKIGARTRKIHVA